MSFNTDWEDFYTTSLKEDDLVDYISINTKRKKYILYNDVTDLITDSVDENDNYNECTNVSREIFEIILLLFFLLILEYLHRFLL